MASDKTTRRDAGRNLFGEEYRPVMEFTWKSKLCTGQYIIGRMLSLCHAAKKGDSCISRKDASNIVAKELIDDWISKNVYPMDIRTVSKKILDDYERFKDMRKYENRPKTKSEKWYSQAKQFNDNMTTRAYDVRAKSDAYQKQLESTYRVVMTNDDVAFYDDNCHGSYVATCTRTVPQNWLKQQKRTIDRQLRYNEKMREAVETAHEEQFYKQQQLQDGIYNCNVDSQFVDPDYTETSTPLPILDISSPCPKLRSGGSVTTPLSEKDSACEKFPKIKIRTGRKTFNESLMRCFIQCVAQCKVTTEVLKSIFVNIANTVFGQNWRFVPEDDNEDSEGDDTDCEEAVQESGTSKRKRFNNNLDYVMPSRRSVARYLEDAYFLNLEMVAKVLAEKGDSVVTVGLDDTTKLAGHKIFDVKSDHITVSGPSHDRKSFTTGFIENISHSGEDGAKGYTMKLNSLAVLANTTPEEIKQNIDFWMTDRAADCSVLLQELKISDERVLKCCAHVILGVDHAINKVFKDTEQKIGVQNLIPTSAGSKIFMSPGTSIHSLGLIAISKLLSPSHAQHSVSLYNEFTAYMDSRDIKPERFNGFVANRFGRIAELAKCYLKMKDTIQDFFEAVVDVNSNKLVLAVSTYIQNDWFRCCTEIYSLMGELLIFPIIELLGIDHIDQTRHPERTWAGVKDFFDKKLPRIEKIRDDFGKTSTGKGKLISAILDEIVDTLKRQLSEMDYFGINSDEQGEIDKDKLKYAPLTNLGCEGEFAKLDNRIKVSGGLSSVSTHSKKNVIVTNGLLVDSSFVNKIDEEKREKWKWSRASDAVKKVKKIEADFIAQVRIHQKISVQRKEDLKRKKTEKTMIILDKCKAHGGPVTPSSLGTLDTLDEKQLLSEIGYLRATIAPDIRQRRRVKVDGGRYIYQKLSVKDLKDSIKTVIKPEDNIADDIDRLLLNVLMPK